VFDEDGMLPLKNFDLDDLFFVSVSHDVFNSSKLVLFLSLL
jgi:hypothetical protein